MSVVSKLSYQGGQVVAEREVEGGTREIYVVHTPCLLAANKGLNTPNTQVFPAL